MGSEEEKQLRVVPDLEEKVSDHMYKARAMIQQAENPGVFRRAQDNLQKVPYKGLAGSTASLVGFAATYEPIFLVGLAAVGIYKFITYKEDS